jgi:hypothetical protein
MSVLKRSRELSPRSFKLRFAGPKRRLESGKEARDGMRTREKIGPTATRTDFEKGIGGWALNPPRHSVKRLRTTRTLTREGWYHAWLFDDGRHRRLESAAPFRSSKEASVDFIHSRTYLNRGDVVVLNCDTQCNFMLMTDSDFSAYRSGMSFRYHGGFKTHFPARITAPHSGNWVAVLDLGGGSANVRYGFSAINAGSLASSLF